MKLIKTICTLLIFTSLTIFYSCQKEGPTGKDGIDGNANVVSSSITASSWTFNDPSWKITFTYPAITQEIINTGAVLVYLKVGESYNQLPLTFYQSSDYSTSVEVSTFLGGLSIFWTDSDLTQPANPGSRTFKVVVIAASNIYKNKNINYSNYLEVKAAYNLED